MQKDLVSVIIITRNSADVLGGCLDSVLNQTYKQYEIIIVDNGSTDETLSLIHRANATLLVSPKNVGFSKANNQALAIAKGEFVLFLNSDATIAPDFLAVLLPWFRKNHGVGAISGKIFRPSSRGTRIIDSAGLRIDHWRLLPRERGDGEFDEGQYDSVTTVFGAPGACSVYRRSALEMVALDREFLDEDFFAYYEDVDLAWRIQRQNWTALYVPGAIARHHKKGPRGKETVIQIKAFTNRYWCYLKNQTIVDFLFYAPISIPYEILRVFKTLTLNPSWISGYFREWGLLAKMLRKRNAIRRLPKIQPKTHAYETSRQCELDELRHDNQGSQSG